VKRFFLLLVLLLILCGAGFWATRARWEGAAPVVTFSRQLTYVGRSPELGLTVSDPGTGLAHVAVVLSQAGHDTVLAEDQFPPGEHEHTYDVGSLLDGKGGLAEGPATLRVTASDHALRHFGDGNTQEVTQAFTVDVTPPSLDVDSGLHYINQGGSEVAVYRVSPDAVESGVLVGDHFFPGVPQGDGRIALFAFRYDLPVDTPVRVVARDAAGNETSVDLPHTVKPKAFRQRDIVLDDGFLNKVVTDIMSHTPSVKDQGSLIKNYVEINANLRRINHARLEELSRESANQFLWHGAFVQLSNSQVEAVFADRRTYLYGGQRVDQQDHVGFDLSVVAHTPIEAANDGRVVFGEYFGIYGNAVLIDHGAGLMSLYGHMSQIDVKPGQEVTKGEIIGRSGATGLAGGDHLHFGLFIRGVPVNPNEWWDAHWIQDHVLSRMGN
jgi:murein DD-endopeptidase MepM/ murein hydrolase activator NlpD